MSARILHALTDENPELEKQIGCMTGIFQLFDRHHLLTGKRIHNPKRLPSAQSRSNVVSSGARECSPRQATEKLLTNDLIENRGSSNESSGASFSSTSFSSSFSSLECGRTAQVESPLFRRNAHQAAFFKNCRMSQNLNFDNQPNTCNFYQEPGSTFSSVGQSLDIRDVVKDSINGEKRGLPGRAPLYEEGFASNHKESTRAPQLSKSLDGGFNTNRKLSATEDLSESFRVLAKLKEGPWHFSETRGVLRSSSETRGTFFDSQDPRFSYDGVELSRASFDSREPCKSANRLRELPRLSLDSRQSSLRNINYDYNSDPMLTDSHFGNDRTPESMRRRTSVVAKLMGLDYMPIPDPVHKQNRKTKTVLLENQELLRNRVNNTVSTSSVKMNDEIKPDRGSRSPRSASRESSMPHARDNKPLLKVSGARLPLEPAPWRQEESQVSRTTLPRSHETGTKLLSSSSVFSEGERRLKDLEVKQSKRNHRAFKEILEAMQATRRAEKKEEKERSGFLVSRSHRNQQESGIDRNPRSSSRQRRHPCQPLSLPVEKINLQSELRSPIVIMKPAKLVEGSRLHSSAFPVDGLSDAYKFTRDKVPNRVIAVGDSGERDSFSRLTCIHSQPPVRKRSNSGKAEEKNYLKPDLKLNCSSPRAHHVQNENSAKISGSGSPRWQQRNLNMERRSQPPLSPPHLTKPKRQPIKHLVEPGSPSRGRSKSALIGDQCSKIGSKMNFIGHISDELSMRSDSNISLASDLDMEVTSADKSAEAVSSLNLTSHLSLSEDEELMASTTTAPEQPSPISVLDVSFCGDDLSPSPVKTVSDPFTDEGNGESDEIFSQDGWRIMDFDQLLDDLPESSWVLNNEKWGNLELLLQRLRQLSSTSEVSDQIVSLCEITNLDHRYISQILLASGFLLEDLERDSSFKLHHSGQLINHDLFWVLEQTKTRWIAKTTSDGDHAGQELHNQKLHRKLVFDTVNEILATKLLPVNLSWPCLKANKFSRGTPSGQQLLREICLEIDKLQLHGSEGGSLDEDGMDVLKYILREDVNCGGENWTDFCSDVPTVVLDVERLIFKDLVDEVVNWEALGLQTKQSSRRRQLFAK